MKNSPFLVFFSPLFLLSLFACASPDRAAEEEATGAQSEELSSRPPSRECGAVAKAAVRAVESVNENSMRITRTELADGFSDRELVRISIKRGSERDSYMISTESMGGSPCYVYGLQIKSQQTDLTSDNGQVINPNGPSQECGDVAVKAVKAIAQVNGNSSIIVTGTELADGFSDRELVRVKVKLWDGSADSYLVNTESMGGSPCYVYGLQVKSQEGISTED
jgi:hypothetical protein